MTRSGPVCTTVSAFTLGGEGAATGGGSGGVGCGVRTGACGSDGGAGAAADAGGGGGGDGFAFLASSPAALRAAPACAACFAEMARRSRSFCDACWPASKPERHCFSGEGGRSSDAILLARDWWGRGEMRTMLTGVEARRSSRTIWVLLRGGRSSWGKTPIRGSAVSEWS